MNVLFGLCYPFNNIWTFLFLFFLDFYSVFYLIAGRSNFGFFSKFLLRRNAYLYIGTYLTYLTYLRSIDRIECSYWFQTNRCHYFELSIGIAQPFLQVIRKLGLLEDDSLPQAQVIDCQHLQM